MKLFNRYLSEKSNFRKEGLIVTTWLLSIDSNTFSEYYEVWKTTVVKKRKLIAYRFFSLRLDLFHGTFEGI